MALPRVFCLSWASKDLVVSKRVTEKSLIVEAEGSTFVFDSIIVLGRSNLPFLINIVAEVRTVRSL